MQVDKAPVHKKLRQGPALPVAQRNPRSSFSCGLQTDPVNFLIPIESTHSRAKVTGLLPQRRGRDGVFPETLGNIQYRAFFLLREGGSWEDLKDAALA